MVGMDAAGTRAGGGCQEEEPHSRRTPQAGSLLLDSLRPVAPAVRTSPPNPRIPEQAPPTVDKSWRTPGRMGHQPGHEEHVSDNQRGVAGLWGVLAQAQRRRTGERWRGSDRVGANRATGPECVDCVRRGQRRRAARVQRCSARRRRRRSRAIGVPVAGCVGPAAGAWRQPCRAGTTALGPETLRASRRLARRGPT